MPNIKSAAKRLRQSRIRRTRNRAAKSSIKTQLKKVDDLLTSGNAAGATAEMPKTAKKLDQAAAKGIIHRNAAARLKSRLSRRLKTSKK